LFKKRFLVYYCTPEKKKNYIKNARKSKSFIEKNLSE